MRNGLINVLLTLMGLVCGITCSFSQEMDHEKLVKKVDREVRMLMQEGDIPGLSLILVKGDQQTIRSYGYADISLKKPVTSTTLFELGSCSKAFTALAVMQLEQQKKLRLDAYVSEYIPWFRTSYQGQPAKITVRQLLHHTSGIPQHTISIIPQTNDENALEQTVRQLVGQALNHRPGKAFEYATINYDVLALLVQRTAGQSFESYLQENIISALRLPATTIATPADSALLATGYKIGFFQPRAYQAPRFRGNNAAGYVISNAEDVAQWLQFQLGRVEPALYRLAQLTHRRDETVPLHGMSSYAMGWDVSLSGNGEISHAGLNPNYTAYLAVRPGRGLGVAVLANANSGFTPVIGGKVMQLLAGEEPEKSHYPDDKNDRASSIISLIVGGYILVVFFLLIKIAVDIAAKRRKYAGVSYPQAARFAASWLVTLPFMYGLYLLPEAMAGFSWRSIIVWAPVSLPVAAALVVAAIGLSYFLYLLSLLFPEKDKYKRIAPQLLLMSILSGLSNMLIIMLITSSLAGDEKVKYLIFYYFLMLTLYLLGRRMVQVNLIKFSRELTYELRIKLFEKLFSTSYQQFESIDRGRVYTAVNDDVEAVGESANAVVMLVTNFITAIGAFLFLAAIAFWATIMTVLLILVLVTLYYQVVKRTARYYEEARDTRNRFMTLVNGMIDGFKEISMKRSKKLEYKADLAATAHVHKEKTATAGIRFVNASLIGETVLVSLLGAVVFAFPKAFPGIQHHTMISFVVVLLYLIGPINTILASIPVVTKLRIAWNRIQALIHEIPANLDPQAMLPVSVPVTLESIRAEGVEFGYKGENEQLLFAVGPIDLEVKKGEILFITGGNGSGKTTLIKLLTGMYRPQRGHFRINGEVVEPGRLGEYISTVFSSACLFEKLYGIDVSGKADKIKDYMKILGLEKKVEIRRGKYSTIQLSGGQRKRLALLQCYLEDSPIYVLDEWAAEQDPEYRYFFYKTLLPKMKEMGKIVIAVTHDDHYYEVADKVIRINYGKIEAPPTEHLFAAANRADDDR